MEAYLIAAAAAGILILLVLSFVLIYNRLQKLRIKVEEGSADIDVALEKRFDLLNEEIEAVKKYLSHEYQLLTDVTRMRAGVDEEEEKRRQQQEMSKEALKTIDEQIFQQTERMEAIKRRLAQNSLRKGRIFGGNRDRSQELADGEAEFARSVTKHDAVINQKINLLASAHRDLANIGSNVDALSEQYPNLNSWISMDHFQRSIFDSEEHLQAARRLYNANASLYNQALESIPWSVVAALCHMEKAPFYEVEERKKSFTVNFD